MSNILKSIQYLASVLERNWTPQYLVGLDLITYVSVSGLLVAVATSQLEVLVTILEYWVFYCRPSKALWITTTGIRSPIHCGYPFSSWSWGLHQQSLVWLWLFRSLIGVTWMSVVPFFIVKIHKLEYSVTVWALSRNPCLSFKSCTTLHTSYLIHDIV